MTKRSPVARIARSSLLLGLLVSIGVATAAGSVRWLGERRFAVVPDTSTGHGSLPLDEDSAGETQRVLLDTDDDTPSVVLSLPHGDAAFRARLDLIGLAERTIDVQYYTLDDSDVGRALLTALAEAADRGVEVRLLLDDIGLAGREAILTHYAGEHDTLSIRVFNPTWLRTFRQLEYVARFPRANRRMHNKSLTVDGIASIVGGRNIGEGYFNQDDSLNFSDLDVLAIGATSEQTRRAFDRYWRSGIAFDIADLRGADATLDTAERQDWRASGRAALARWRDASAQPRSGVMGALKEAQVAGIPAMIRTIADPPGKVMGELDELDGTVAPEVLGLLSSARDEVLITSPYLIPGDEGMKVFQALRERGVAVSIMTNSYAANDVAAVHVGYSDYRKPLLELGIALHEFKPDAGAAPWSYMDSFIGRSKTALHTKAFVIDRRIGFVGSFNLDPRSAMHNTEMGVVIDSAEFASELHDLLQRSLAERAWEVELTPEGALRWRDRAEGEDRIVSDVDPGTVFPQRVLLWLASWLPIDWLL